MKKWKKLTAVLLAGLLLAMQLSAAVLAQDAMPVVEKPLAAEENEAAATGQGEAACRAVDKQLSYATSGNYTYDIVDGGAVITGHTGTVSGELTIPAQLGGYPIREIGDWAFNSCNSLTSVIIPQGVTSIGRYAFYECTGLTSITIPDSVSMIGWGCFNNCIIKELNIAEESKTVTSGWSCVRRP